MGFRVHIYQWLVVSVHFTPVSVKVRPPLHAGLKDGQKFTITHMVPCFCKWKLFGGEQHKMSTLTQLSTSGTYTGIVCQFKRYSKVWQYQHWSGSQQPLQQIKSLLICLPPHKVQLIRQNATRRRCYTCKSTYKSVAIVSTSKKLLSPYNVLRCRPISYSRNLIRVYMQFTITNHMPKILDT